MRLHRFYIKEEVNGKSITILEERPARLNSRSGGLLNQWKNVFRYKPGDRVILFNGGGNEFEAEIESLDRKEARLNIIEEKEGIKLNKNIILYQSLIKKDNMEWVVEKATELGVSKIVPIISERSEKKGFNIERANKIAVEASEQCGRADVPEITEVIYLSEALTNVENAVVFDGSGEPLNNSEILKDQAVSVFIGSEGGWAPVEIEKFKEAKIQIFSLGKLTLRAETASIVSLSLFL